MNTSNSQLTVRKQIRRARRNLSVQQQRRAGFKLAQLVLYHPRFLSSKRIAFYLPNDGEIDPTCALDCALNIGKFCYLPVLYRGGVNRLLFGRVTRESKFTPNRFGIPEPNIATEGWVYPLELDLMLTPLVAFDILGNRIGMGGGFYDNTLSYLWPERNWRRPYVLGLAHEFQRINSIKENKWDIPLQTVITDKQVYNFK